MSKPAKLPDREWSFPIVAEEIPASWKSYTLSPSEPESKAIAKRLDLISLDALEADVRVERKGHVVEVEGKFKAKVTQRCVVTLEPLKAELEDSFEAWYADHEQVVSFKKAQHESMNKKEMMDLPMLEENEDPEPIEDGKIDLGELVVQYLSLSVEPYPHKEGVEYENQEPEVKRPQRETLRPNPFAALKNWRPKD